MTAKQLFLKNDRAVKTMLMVVADPDFETALLYAKLAFVDEKKPAPDQIQALNQFLDILRDLPNDETELQDVKGPGLEHDLDIAPRLKRATKKENKK